MDVAEAFRCAGENFAKTFDEKSLRNSSLFNIERKYSSDYSHIKKSNVKTQKHNSEIFFNT